MDKEPSKEEIVKASLHEIHVDDELTLRELGPVDTDEYYDLFDRNREHTAKYGTNLDMNKLDVVLWLANKTDNIPFGIRENGVLVGRFDLRPMGDGNAIIGYWIDKSRQGNGIIERSLREVLRYAHEELDVQTVQAMVLKNNERSVKVLKKQGFEVSEKSDRYDWYQLKLSN